MLHGLVLNTAVAFSLPEGLPAELVPVFGHRPAASPYLVYVRARQGRAREAQSMPKERTRRMDMVCGRRGL